MGLIHENPLRGFCLTLNFSFAAYAGTLPLVPEGSLAEGRAVR